jgi:hypothetical protein
MRKLGAAKSRNDKQLAAIDRINPGENYISPIGIHAEY